MDAERTEGDDTGSVVQTANNQKGTVSDVSANFSVRTSQDHRDRPRFRAHQSVDGGGPMFCCPSPTSSRRAERDIWQSWSARGVRRAVTRLLGRVYPDRVGASRM